MGGQETMHAWTLACVKRVSFSVVFLESLMALLSYGRPSATGAPSAIVDSMQALFGRAGAQTPRRLE